MSSSRCTCYVDVILLLENRLANRKPHFDMSGGHPWQVHVQVTHKMGKFPVLESKASRLFTAALMNSMAVVSNEHNNSVRRKTAMNNRPRCPSPACHKLG